MNKAYFQTAADVFDGWRDHVLTGEPSTIYPVGTGELERLEVGSKLVSTHRGRTRSRQDGIHNAVRCRCFAADRFAARSGLQHRNAVGSFTRSATGAAHRSARYDVAIRPQTATVHASDNGRETTGRQTAIHSCDIVGPSRAVLAMAIGKLGLVLRIGVSKQAGC